MFNRASAGQSLPKHVSTDHDPLFRFHRWLANLRVLEIEEIKSVPYAPVSHPFVERLIGTIRREYLDRVFFWNAVDLARKLGEFRDYYNAHRVHRSLDGTTPAQRAGAPSPAPAALDALRLAAALSWSVSDPDCRLNINSPPTGYLSGYNGGADLSTRSAMRVRGALLRLGGRAPRYRSSRL